MIWGHQEAELTETDSLWPKHRIAFPFPWNWAGSACGCKQSLSSSFYKAQEPEPWKLRGRCEKLLRTGKISRWEIERGEKICLGPRRKRENLKFQHVIMVFMLGYVPINACAPSSSRKSQKSRVMLSRFRVNYAGVRGLLDWKWKQTRECFSSPAWHGREGEGELFNLHLNLRDGPGGLG